MTEYRPTAFSTITKDRMDMVTPFIELEEGEHGWKARIVEGGLRVEVEDFEALTLDQVKALAEKAQFFLRELRAISRTML